MNEYISRACIMRELTKSDPQIKMRSMTPQQAYEWFVNLVNSAPAVDAELLIARRRFEEWRRDEETRCACAPPDKNSIEDEIYQRLNELAKRLERGTDSSLRSE